RQRCQGVSRLAQAHGILEQAAKFFPKAPPRASGGELVDFDQFGEQVKVAFLFGESLDRVVGAPEVGNQYAREERAEHARDDRGAAMRIDEVVAGMALT